MRLKIELATADSYFSKDGIKKKFGSNNLINGGQGRDRTADLRVMNPPLSPSELPGRILYCP